MPKTRNGRVLKQIRFNEEHYKKLKTLSSDSGKFFNEYLDEIVLDFFKKSEVYELDHFFTAKRGMPIKSIWIKNIIIEEMVKPYCNKKSISENCLIYNIFLLHGESEKLI